MCGARFARRETGRETAEPPSSVRGSLSSSELKNGEQEENSGQERGLAHRMWESRWVVDTCQRSASSAASSCGGAAVLLGIPCWQWKSSFRSNLSKCRTSTGMSDSKQPVNPPRSRRRPLVASLLAFAAVLAISRAPTSQDYALCSPGGKIYTVDTAHPTVECIVVSNTTIADVGSLGASSSFTFLGL